LHYQAAGRSFEISAGGFWQTHPQAADVFTDTVLTAAGLMPGERALDLYAGAGLFTAALAGAVTSTGSVLGLEADRAAVEDAVANLADVPWASARQVAISPAAVDAAGEELEQVAAVVLDPPRTGAGREVLSSILAVAQRVVVYVACDPAALARDVRTATDAGWELTDLRAFDAFPMTHHVECIATLRPADTARRDSAQPGSDYPDTS
jgi:tRNA/tmRNA/rRNA uracil-C5-methylase (TrmA/RlmC/RlmD family)